MAQKMIIATPVVAGDTETQEESASPLAGAESGFVHFAVGPSTSILDRARDLLRSRPA